MLFVKRFNANVLNISLLLSTGQGAKKKSKNASLQSTILN